SGWLGLDGAIGLDVEHELVQVRALLNTRRFDGVAYASHRRERCVEQDAADRAAAFWLDAGRRRLIAASLLDLDLHFDLAARSQMRDHVLGLDVLHAVVRFDVLAGDRTVARLR